MAEVTAELKELADKIVGLTLKQAVDLAAYLKDEHGIQPAAGGGGGGGPAAAGAAAPVEAEPEKTTFDVVLKAAGDKKIQVIKEVRGGPHRDGPGPEGGQGPGRGRAQDRQGRPGEARGREVEEGPGGPGRDRRAQVTPTVA